VNTTDTYLNPVYNIPEDASAEWNPVANSDMPTGAELWTTNIILGAIVLLVFFISLAIFYIRIIA
jgi:hypothetical protein